MPGDVADDHRELAVVEREDVVEVAARGRARRRGGRRPRFPPGRSAPAARQQRRLERADVLEQRGAGGPGAARARRRRACWPRTRARRRQSAPIRIHSAVGITPMMRVTVVTIGELRAARARVPVALRSLGRRPRGARGGAPRPALAAGGAPRGAPGAPSRAVAHAWRPALGRVPAPAVARTPCCAAIDGGAVLRVRRGATVAAAAAAAAATGSARAPVSALCPRATASRASRASRSSRPRFVSLRPSRTRRSSRSLIRCSRSRSRCSWLFSARAAGGAPLAPRRRVLSRAPCRRRRRRRVRARALRV